MTAFEARYRADADPWRTLTDPYELGKRRRTLAACGPGPFDSACELGAGLGVLTAELAPRCSRLLALDAAPTAVAAAADRLAPFAHAEARVAVAPDDLPAERFDLIVASEVLYYLDADALAATAAWAARALVAGGRLVAVGWTGEAPDMPGDAAGAAAALARRSELRAVEVQLHLGYRIDVLERAA
jgi:cyclopropane fatty-acyl-phospholipid synthase-like methyltransferase